MLNMGRAVMGTGEAAGEGQTRAATEAAPKLFGRLTILPVEGRPS